MQFMNFAYLIERYMFIALGLAIVALAVWAVADCLRQKPERFMQEGKRTKGFWTALTVGGLAVAILSVVSLGGGFLQLIAACVVCVYLADVKPAVSGSIGGFYY